MQELGLDVKRIDDKKEQVSGVDAILTCERLGIKDVAVDEKCASAYWNKKINTFSFELSFLKFGNLRQGWFVNENLKTEYYNICWLNATKKWFKCEDITWFEMALVNKNASLIVKDVEAEEKLIPLAINTVKDTTLLNALSENALSMAFRDADTKIAEEILKLIKN